MMWMPTKEERMLEDKVFPWLRDDPNSDSLKSILAPEAPKDVQHAYRRLEEIYATLPTWG